jgi:multiple sugar transport system substrate-binding protein
MRELKKIMILALITALIVSILFIGTSCKQEEVAEEEVAEEEVAEEEEEVAEEPSGTVEIWSYVPEDNPGFYSYMEEFNESQDKITVEGKFIPFAEFKRQLTVALAGGTAPDCATVDNPDYAAYIALGAFEALDDRIAEWEWQQDDFYPGPWASATWEGKQYGIPFETNTLVLFYNVDMFEAAGLDPDSPPTTWEELTDYAEKLTKDGVYGLSVCAVASEEGTFQWLPFLQQNGGDVFNLGSPEAVEALQLWVDWIENGYISEEVLTFDQWAGVRPQFQNEQAAMMINGPWCIVPMQTEVPDLNWRVAVLPGRVKQASAMGGVDIGIIEGSEDADAAWEYIKWLYSPERVAEFWHSFGTLPLIPEIAESATYWQGDPILEVVLEQMKYSAPRGPHPRWPEISTAIFTAMQEALTGEKSAEDALADAAAKVEEITAE